MRIFIFILLSFTHYLTGMQWTEQSIDRSGEHAGRVSKKVSRHIEQKYGLSCCGAGLSMPGGPIRSIALSFSINGPLTFSQLRRLTVGCIDDMIKIISNDREIQPYLHSPSRGLHNINLNIFVQDNCGREVMFPYASGTSVIQSKIVYYYSDPEKIVYPYLKKVKETYEEALEAIRQEDAMVEAG